MTTINSLTWFELLVLAIATWRLANMLAREHGPWRMFETMREKLPLGGLTACIYCMSVWCAVVLYGLHLLGRGPDILIVVLAISGAALMLKSFTGAGHDV